MEAEKCKCEVNVSDLDFSSQPQPVPETENTVENETEVNEENAELPIKEENLIDPDIEGTLGLSEDEDEMEWKTLGKKYSELFGDVKNVLIDIEGTLYRERFDGIAAIPGVVKALDALRKYEINICLITNSYKGSKNDICRTLKSKGIRMTHREIFTSADVCKKILRENKLRPYLLVDENVAVDFEQVECKCPNSVVVGLPSTQFDYRLLSKGLSLLMDGCPLIVLNDRPVEAVEGRSTLVGPGTFVNALEFLTCSEQIMIGKPSKAFYEMVLKCKNFDPKETLVIGDDIREDLEGVKELGMRTALVKTGVYGSSWQGKRENLDANIPQADFIAEDIVQVIKYMLKSYSVAHGLEYTDSDVEMEKIQKKKMNILVDPFGKTRMEQDDFISRLEAYADEECATKHHACPLKVPDYVW